MAGKPKYGHITDDEIVQAVRDGGNLRVASAALAVPYRSLQSLVQYRELYARVDEARTAHGREQSERNARLQPETTAESELATQVHALIKRRRSIDIGDLADQLDTSPKRIRVAADELRERGYRIPDEKDTGGAIVLEPVNPAKVNLHRSLLEGDELVVGVVSDTHLCSNEQALDELELAYDHFAELGITEVWHAGDWVAGRGIFRTQDAEVLYNTFERQVGYAVDNYPRRDGIVTRGIAGNHDIEGEFGKIGANPVAAIANRRDDIEYLGDFSAWVELPGGSWVHLLHGKGGMSYAVSYKAQKIVDGYSAGRKPAVLIPGHWHVRGDWQARGVQVLFPGCFEWRTPLLERLGLSPAVGFHVLRMTIGPDGSVVRWQPQWFPFWEGRTVAAAAA